LVAGLVTFLLMRSPRPPAPITYQPTAKPEPTVTKPQPTPTAQAVPPIVETAKETTQKLEPKLPKKPPNVQNDARKTSPVAGTVSASEEFRQPQPPPPVKPCTSDFNMADYEGPHSGWFEWSGPPGRVTILGRSASSGKIRGSLPGGIPVRVDAPQGVVVVEQPSCQNKWSELVFDQHDAPVPLKFTWNVY
jgi:hypothetical protein